jgi:MarR family 2-MHQ and catechol resistance regulon transcriptional repressor
MTNASPQPGVYVWLILMKAYQALQKHAERSIQDGGLCFSDFVILEVLLHKGPQPINSIGNKLLLTSGSLTAAVDRLEKKGWVIRQAHASDRRSRLVVLTETGKTFINALFQEHAHSFEPLMSVLSPDERETLTGLLKKLGKHAAEQLEIPSTS